MPRTSPEAPILLTSLPRSGSTWTHKVLEQAPGIFGLFEPDHLDVYGLGTPGMHPYLAQGETWPGYQRMFANALRGIHTPARRFSRKGARVSASNQLRRARLDRRRVLLKSVFSLHNTLWLADNFELQVVVLLRNPYSIAHSIHRKWPDAVLGDGVFQSHFVDECLRGYEDSLSRADTPFEKLGARIGAYYKSILEAAERNPSWIVISHEELCSDPLKGFRELYRQCDLEWSPRIEAYIQSTNQPKKNDAIAHVNRVSAEEIDKWRTLLEPRQQREIQRFYDVYERIPYRGLLEDRETM